jgi:hypothetical protein
VVRQTPTEHLAYALIVGVDLGPNLLHRITLSLSKGASKG